MSDLSERDRELLAKFGMTEEQVERDERMAESETEPDGLTGRVHYGLHRETGNERRQVTQEPAPKILGASGLVTVRRSCVGACPSSRVPAPYRS